MMRLDHVQLAMSPGGEERARAFFSSILGMREEEKPVPLSGRGGAWFRTGGAVLHLGVEEGFRPQRKAHPAFLVGDLEALAGRLAAADHAVEWDEALPGRRRFYSADPFGNRIEFIADGDGFSQEDQQDHG